MSIYLSLPLSSFVNQFLEIRRELAMAAVIEDQQQPGTLMSRSEEIDSAQVGISEEEIQRMILGLEELLATADQVEDASPEKMESHGGGEETVEVDEDDEIFGGLEPLDLGPRYNAWILEDCSRKLSS